MSPGLNPAAPTSTKSLTGVARLMGSIFSGWVAVPNGMAPTETAPTVSATAITPRASVTRLADMGHLLAEVGARCVRGPVVVHPTPPESPEHEAFPSFP